VRDLLESDTVADDAAAARAEWRAEEEQWSRAALERWEHGRGLDDVLRDCMQRGDTATFVFATVGWSGVVTAVGRDVAHLHAGDAEVDVRVAADAPFVLRTHSGDMNGARDRRDGGALTTFLARLRELDGTAVCIGTPTGPLEGQLRVGRQQVRLTTADGGVAYVPTGSLSWVRPLDAD
jgi:hypothetical protein